MGLYGQRVMPETEPAQFAFTTVLHAFDIESLYVNTVSLHSNKVRKMPLN